MLLCGKNDRRGNFVELLRLRTEDNDNLKSWIAKFDEEKRRQRLYLSHDIQNEIISDISKEISLLLKYEVLQSKYFCLMCDGTRDMSGMEQECVSIRFVDHDFVPQEVFVGLYQINETTGQNVAAILKGVCIRYSLSLKIFRGQVFDGASNMSGAYNGAKAIVLREQHLAYDTHCKSHCTNLVAFCISGLSGIRAVSLCLTTFLG